MASTQPSLAEGGVSRASFASASPPAPAGDVQRYLNSSEFQLAIRNAPSATSDAGSVAHELLSRRAPKSGYRFSTLCATVDDPAHHDQYGSSSVPVYLSATFKGPPGAEFDYSRSGNPTRSMLQHHLSQLQNCRFSFAVSSGMACLDVITRLLKPGERIVAGDDLYGGSNRLLGYLKSHGGIEADHVDTTDASKVEALLAERAQQIKDKVPGIGPVKMVLLETPTNPLIKIIDLKRCCKAAKHYFPDAIVVVDNTMMSPYLMRPLELGADISYDSGTKYLSGHHDLMAGIISCDREDVGKDIAFTINAVGNALTPLDCFLLLRGIKTLAVRMDRQQAASYRVANYLEGLGFKVNYPGLASHPGKDIHDQQAAGPGAVLSFETFDDEVSKRIVGAARLWGISVSFGCVNSLISMPCLMSHASIPAEIRKARRLPEDLIRLCVGIEDPRDLIDDLQSALLAAGAIKRRDGKLSDPANEEENELEYVRVYERVPVNTDVEAEYLGVKAAVAASPITAVEPQSPSSLITGPSYVGVATTQERDDSNQAQIAHALTPAKERSDPDATSDAVEASAAPGRTSLLEDQEVAADGSVLPRSTAHGVGQDHSSDLPPELVVSAPGKVILFGEHAVVHGVPAIAGAVDLRCYGHVTRRTDGKVSLQIPDVGASFEWPTKDLPWPSLPKAIAQGHVEDGTDLPTHADESLDDSLRHAVEEFVERTTPAVNEADIKGRQARSSAVAFLYLFMCIAGPRSGVQGQGFVFRSALPLSAGLGSSAAYSSCLASALIFSHGHLPLPEMKTGQELDGATKAVLNSWAFLAEKILHGTPSGVDNTVAVYGGAVAFTRAHARNGLLRNQIEQLNAANSDGTVPHMKAWRLLLTDTRVPRDTKRLVASVGHQLASEPARVQGILSRIEDIATQASALLSAAPNAKAERALGTLFTANHKALDELQVSHPALEQVRALALESPLKLATKLTGAGGGGCAISLVPAAAAEDQVEQLESALVQAGFQTHEIEVGGPGVGVYVPGVSSKDVGSAAWIAANDGGEVARWAQAQQGWIYA